MAGVPTCMPLDAYAVSCSAVRRIELDLDDGPDVAVIATPHPVSLEGGAGNDRYVALATDAPSRVDFDGGIGLDTANYGFATAGVDVRVDLEAGDGRPGDDDRIRRDVESVLGSQFADVLAGSPRTVQLAGLDGDDRDHRRHGRGAPLRRSRQRPHRRPRRRARHRRLRRPGVRLGRGRHRRRGLHHRLRQIVS